ncbi:MAG: class I SAM-dependent methyltransferase, partial [Candidatus Thermoplasmatota archaeon]|nr:class I SAM-dependent methyltransferase [Candidatus Thermoplasmatota archaeon]
VYNNPKYYEIAFSFRDISKEVDFIEQVIAKESRIPVKAFLEIASGNSPHMKELCKRGYSYIGLELSKQMIEYSREIIKKSVLQAEIVEGDMIKFSLPKPVDYALLFLGSFYIKSNEELHSHLDSVANAVRSGGLYILDGAVSFYPEDIRKQSWEMIEGNIKVVTTYDPKWIDKVGKISEAKITLDIDDNGEKKKIEHLEIRKIYSVDEFMKKVQETGKWECVDSFSDFDMAKKPYNEGRNIVVLRRK